MNTKPCKIPSAFIATLIGPILLLSACGQGSRSEQPQQSNKLVWPTRIAASSLDKNAMSAWVRIDDGERIAMQLDTTTGVASFEALKLDTGTHQFSVEFDFDAGNLGSFTLTRGSKSIKVNKGRNVLDFKSEDFTVFPDEDNDQYSNLEELEKGTDPTNPQSKPASGVPWASNVILRDSNGGYAVIGDVLEGSYTYNDFDGDEEGGSVYRWYRNGTLIEGATGKTYTLQDSADMPAQFVFEVTPVAASGDSPGLTVRSAILSSGNPPLMESVSYYIDVNHNGVSDNGDHIVVPFNQNILTNGVSSADFFLPTLGNTFGEGSYAQAGPADHEVTIVLGDAPVLKIRQDYQKSISKLAPSGIVLSAKEIASITGVSGVAAALSKTFDIIPGFLPSEVALGNASSQQVALGDLDNNGSLDMVVANVGGGNRLYINDGNGNFSVSTQVLGNNDSRAVALGDVDHDGDLDMVFANAQANTLYINEANGQFSLRVENMPTEVFDSRDIALQDVDLDGDLDIVVANFSAQPDRIYFNDGQGVFTDSGMSLGNSDSMALTLGDIDGDGDADLIVANASGANPVYINELLNAGGSRGNFVENDVGVGDANSRDVALHDLNRDGHLDLVVANQDSASNRLYWNDGNGNFLSATPLSLGKEDSRAVVILDYDQDGDADLVFANGNDQANSVYLNNGVGEMSPSGLALGAYNSQSVQFGDVDGDGDADLVVANELQGNRVYLNSVSASWGTYDHFELDTNQDFSVYSLRSLAIGDVNGDAQADLVVAQDVNQINHVLLNDASGNFSELTQDWLGQDSYDLRLSDLDRDGDLDLVVANNNAANLTYFNDGAGNFVAAESMLGTAASRALVLGDLDLDGDPDMVVGNFAAPNQVFFNTAGNTGESPFLDSGQSLGKDETIQVVLRDLDQDGDLDLLEANLNSAPRLLFNDNNNLGQFINPVVLAGDNAVLALQVGDIDGDGDVDIVSSAPGGVLTIYKNGGADNSKRGTFNVAQTLTTVEYQSILLIDFDADGDLDILASDPGMEQSDVYLNGNEAGSERGSFAQSALSVNLPGHAVVRLHDIDHDGDLDVMLGDETNGLQIYFNR